MSAALGMAYMITGFLLLVSGGGLIGIGADLYGEDKYSRRTEEEKAGRRKVRRVLVTLGSILAALGVIVWLVGLWHGAVIG